MAEALQAKIDVFEGTGPVWSKNSGMGSSPTNYSSCQKLG